MASLPTDPVGYVQLAAGAFMMLLAAWAFLLNTGSRLNQALALVLFVRGVLNVAQSVGDWPSLDEPLSATGWYASVALPFALLFFGYVYRVQSGVMRARRWIPWALLAATALVETILFLDHDLAFAGPDRGPLARDGSGPLYLLHGAFALLFALTAYILVRDARAVPAGPRRESLLLTSAGFALLPAFNGVTILLTWMYWFLDLFVVPLPQVDASSLFSPAEFFWDLNLLLHLAGLIPLTLIVVALVRARRQVAPAEKKRFNDYLAAMAVAAGSLVVPWGAAYLAFAQLNRVLYLMTSLWVLAFPVLVSFAIFRHQLFGLDYKVKVSLRRGTLVAVFVAVFFIVAQGAQLYFQNGGNWVVGSVACGLLLFMIGPLQRWSDRVANTALPGAKPVAEMSNPERVRLYREWCEIAWADGQLGVKERQLLETARERLGLGADEALRLEREITRRVARTA